ncbi:MAG: hypothetical protein E7085_01600 [Parabacteroides distasonis]|nr:hypothetical protein [Parabacteroides distasonis]
MKSTITFVPIGGLANRVLAITSAIAFCQDYQVKLRILWFKDWGMGADFHSIMEFSQSFKDIEIIDANWKYYIYDRPRKRNFWIPKLWQKFIFDKRFYDEDMFSSFSVKQLIDVVKKYKSVYLVHCSDFYKKDNILQYLKPTSKVLKLIEERRIQLGLDENMIGIHIRRTDHIQSIQESPLSLFFDVINKEMLNNSTVRFYVASDDLGEKLRLKNVYGDRIVTLLDKVTRDNEQGILDAIVELYTLASMKKIYGSSNSTYSILAAQLSNIDLEILSICNK